MESTPITFDSIILTGSILTPDYKWEEHIGKKVGRVLNEKAPNDPWVKLLPKVKLWGMEEMMGRSGVEGFNQKVITERTNEIYDHNNVIKRDTISKFWVPFLNKNRGKFDLDNVLHSSLLFKNSK
ncbi:hypothetical protein FZC78_06485 [Rossellomorea vietnamensis]|uniref:Uncharacterized protein n=1 Tax=Rossellomorea vietnamensis TaxID=218284 RepID=A0A5D4NV15_9BACI|nr:hypothetical protein [Rossellomorea vietnamensis]TYS17521.1 hypothetical protein FZC78_06485 [Rossellomorea vietnamensis]